MIGHGRRRPPLPHPGVCSHPCVVGGEGATGRGDGVAQIERVDHLEGPADPQQLVVGDLQRLGVDRHRAATVGTRWTGAVHGLPPRRLGQGVAQQVQPVAVDQGVDDVAAQVAVERPPDVGPRRRQVEAGGTRRRLVAHGDAADAADAERPHAGGSVGLGDEVPDAALEHEPQRIEAAADEAVAALVADVDAPSVPQGRGESAQRRHRFGRLEPARHVDEEALAQPGCACSQLGREGGVDLRLGGDQHRPEAEVGGGAGDAGEGEGCGLGTGQPGEPGLVAAHQLDAAAGTALAVDRDTGRAERLDVAVDGAHRHLELGRQLVGGGASAPLQQEQQLDEAAGAHVAIVDGITDRRCQ